MKIKDENKKIKDIHKTLIFSNLWMSYFFFYFFSKNEKKYIRIDDINHLVIQL